MAKDDRFEVGMVISVRVGSGTFKGRVLAIKDHWPWYDRRVKLVVEGWVPQRSGSTWHESWYHADDPDVHPSTQTYDEIWAEYCAGVLSQ
jgi:hypothetical protein